MHIHLRRIAISTVIAIATIVSSMPIAHSGSPQYLARNTQSFGTFRSKAACIARGRRLIRSGVLIRYRCSSSGKVWILRSGADRERNLGGYAVPRIRKIGSKTYRTTRHRTTRTIRRTVRGGRYRSMAACIARGRALVRAGKIVSFKCTPTL